LRIALLGVSAAAAIAAFAACKEPSGGNTCASIGGVPVDARNDSSFVPASVTITPTQRACWQNLSTLTHTITADNLIADSIDITLPPNYTYSKGWGTSGKDFAYHCRFHPGMTGLVQVR
jgi:plastocyanin